MTAPTIAEQRESAGSTDLGPYVLDAFPADIELPDGTVHREVLVVADQERFEVWKDQWPAPILLLAGLHDGFERGSDPRYPASRHQVHTAYGPVLIGTSVGCGCGSKLKSWRPDVPHQTASRR